MVVAGATTRGSSSAGDEAMDVESQVMEGGNAVMNLKLMRGGTHTIRAEGGTKGFELLRHASGIYYAPTIRRTKFYLKQYCKPMVCFF